MRLIDADALELDADYDDGEYWAVSMVQIHNAPTIEPELIRCKDCKYWDSTGYCLYGSRLAWRGNDNDYCSRAKRREE